MPNVIRASSWCVVVLALSISSVFAQAPVPPAAVTSPGSGERGEADLHTVPQAPPMIRGGWGGAYGRAVVGEGPSLLPGPVCQSCLPYRTPWPCGVGQTDCCVNLPYTDFLFYGTDPRDDDPLNHTWTTCVGDMGNHAARKQTRHTRRFGY